MDNFQFIDRFALIVGHFNAAQQIGSCCEMLNCEGADERGQTSNPKLLCDVEMLHVFGRAFRLTRVKK